MNPDELFTPDSPKCAQCSGPILDGELVLRDHDDWVHVRCKQVTTSYEQIRTAKLLSWDSRRRIEMAKQRVEQSRGLQLLGTVERVASAAEGQAHCFPCLAVQLQITEPQVRSVAQILVVRGRFKRTRRVCDSCGRMDDVLVLRD